MKAFFETFRKCLTRIINMLFVRNSSFICVLFRVVKRFFFLPSKFIADTTAHIFMRQIFIKLKSIYEERVRAKKKKNCAGCANLRGLDFTRLFIFPLFSCLHFRKVIISEFTPFQKNIYSISNLIRNIYDSQFIKNTYSD